MLLQEQLPSLIRTAETLKVKGLAEVSTGSEGQAPAPPAPPVPQQQQQAPSVQQQAATQQQQQQHPQYAQHPPGSAVPQSIPLSMVAPTIADSPELQKQVSAARRRPPAAGPAQERDGTRCFLWGPAVSESDPIALQTWPNGRHTVRRLAGHRNDVGVPGQVDRNMTD